MDILSLIGWRIEALEKSGSSRDLILGVGDRLQGRVSRLLSQNLALVDLLNGRFKAIAELKTPLNPGQRLDFKVTATTPRLILQVIHSEKGAPKGAPSAPLPMKASLLILNPQQARSLVSELQTMATALREGSAKGDADAGGSVKFSNVNNIRPAADGINATDAAKVATSLDRLTSHLTPLDPQGDPKAIAAQLRAHVRDGGQLLLQKLVDAVQGQSLDQATASGQGKTIGQGIVTDEGKVYQAGGNRVPQTTGENRPQPEGSKAPAAGEKFLPIAGDKAPPTTGEKTPPVVGGRISHGLGDSVLRELGDGTPKSAESPATRTAAPPTPPSRLLQADLKPHLQRLLIHLPTLIEALGPGQNLSTEGSRHLWSTVAALLDEMESGQTRLTEQRAEDPPAVMRHSMWVEGREEPLRLNVYLPRKKRKGDPAAVPMVSLLLDLDRFGAVRVDVREPMGFHDQQQKLEVRFWMGSQAACDDMGAAVAPLEGILKVLYPLVDLTVSLAPAKIEAFEQESGSVAPTGSNTAKLDIRI